MTRRGSKLIRNVSEKGRSIYLFRAHEGLDLGDGSLVHSWFYDVVE